MNQPANPSNENPEERSKRDKKSVPAFKSAPTPADQLQGFMQRAAPVIAGERGLNDAARAKLRIIAKDMRLSDEAFDQAMETLQHNPPSLQHSLSKYELGFQKSMRAKLKEVPRRILTAKIEKRAVDIGTKKYQLSELQARDILRDLVTELNLQRISVTQSEAYVEATIEKLVGKRTYADKDAKKRLLEIGANWGVSDEVVESMLRNYLDSNLHDRKKNKTASGVLLVGGALVLLAILGGIAYVLSNNNKDPGEQIANTKKGDDPIAASNADFWDEPTKICIAKLAPNHPSISKLQPKIANSDPAIRHSGYQELIKAIPEITSKAQSRQRTKKLLSKLIQLEPDPTNSRFVVDTLLKEANLTAEKLPLVNAKLKQSLWNIELLANSLNELKTSDPSKETVLILQDSLSQVTGMSTLPKEKDKAFIKIYQTEYIQQQLSNLILIAADKPVMATAAFKMLMPLATDISKKTIEQLHLNFIQAALNPAADKWITLDPLMKFSVHFAEKDQFVQLISLFESIKNQKAQKRLGELLSYAVEMKPEANATVAETATRLRNRLGIEEPLSRVQQRKQIAFQEKMRSFIKTVDCKTSSESKLVEQIGATTYWSTIATYYKRGDFDSEFLQKLLKSGPPVPLNQAYLDQLWESSENKLSPSTTDAKKQSSPTNQARIDRLLRIVGSKYKASSSKRRVEALLELAIQAKNIPDIPPSAASDLASYVCVQKKKTEQKEIASAIESFRNWPTFLVAVADGIPDSKLTREEMEVVVQSLIDIPPVNKDFDQWKAAVANSLLKEAQRVFKTAKPTNKPTTGSTVAQLEQLYTELTRIRAANVGVQRSKIAKSDDLLQLLSEWYTTAKNRFSNNATTTQIEIQRDTESIRYLAENRLQKVVLLQLLIVDQLIHQLEAKSIENKPIVTKITKQHTARNANATHILQQMLSNEVAILELLSIP